MANQSTESEPAAGDERSRPGAASDPAAGSQRPKPASKPSIPIFAKFSSRSLFIFSEENFIRKHAKIIIEWGYPLKNINLY